jgi:hypothetical protein
MKIKKKEQLVSGSQVSYSLFPEIKRPKWSDSLVFPDDVTRLEASNISELHGKYTALFAYANQELTKINVEILRLQTEDSVLRNRLLRKSPALNSQERWRRDSVLDSHSDIERLEIRVAQLKMAREHATMYCQNFEKYIAALSRELSRKQVQENARY